MKIALASDLHLEFADIVLKNEEHADVLILSGDICIARELPFSDSHQGQRFRDFFSRCALEFPHVVMVSGNHESYHGDIALTHKLLKDAVSTLPNFHVLEKESVLIEDTIFVGGTLWTDMNEGDPNTIHHVGRLMNDFRCITDSNQMVSYRSIAEDGSFEFKERPSIFSTRNAVEEHDKTLKYIDIVVNNNSGYKFVVVGHHSPSKLSTHPRYQDDTIMNGGYSSDLSQFIMSRPQIKMWTHGHTHHNFDYVIGDTRIVCNPRGYDGYEDQADHFKLQYFEV